jgi:hypothetical protein
VFVRSACSSPAATAERDELAGLDLGDCGANADVFGIAGDRQAAHDALAVRPLERRDVLEAEVAK